MTGRQFIHLVEHEQPAFAARPCARLQQCCPAASRCKSRRWPADFRLVVHSAEAHAPELESDRLGDALTERGLAHAGRTDEAQNGTAAFRVELAHGQEFQYAALDLLQTKMILIEDGARLVDVDRLGIDLGPRHGEQPVEVAAGHGVFRRRGPACAPSASARAAPAPRLPPPMPASLMPCLSSSRSPPAQSLSPNSF